MTGAPPSGPGRQPPLRGSRTRGQAFSARSNSNGCSGESSPWKPRARRASHYHEHILSSTVSKVRPLSQTWKNALSSLVAAARSELLITSPYVSSYGTDLVLQHLSGSMRESGRLLFLTDLSPLNVYQASTDPAALMSLNMGFEGTTVRHLPRVHAKVYVADGELAIVTSGIWEASCATLSSVSSLARGRLCNKCGVTCSILPNWVRSSLAKSWRHTALRPSDCANRSSSSDEPPLQRRGGNSRKHFVLPRTSW
jgi:hypothetical protein